MLNKIWPVLLLISIFYGIISGNVENMNNAIFNSTESAISTTITMLGTICLWNGLMKIVSNLKIIEKLCNLISPLINFLFPEIKKNKKIKKEISMNIIANLLGLGNAATPLGIKAMESMQKENNNKECLSNSMITFILINTASIQIIPTTIFAIRKSLNSTNITSIIIPIWCSSIIAFLIGIISVKILIKRTNRKYE